MRQVVTQKHSNGCTWAPLCVYLAFIGRQRGSDNVERKFVARQEAANVNNYDDLSGVQLQKQLESKVTKCIITTPSEPLFYFSPLFVTLQV